tara:strand:+ start:266 stop:1180 length:915 start_codon:yes stop_codon:yes gene_type:complete
MKKNCSLIIGSTGFIGSSLLKIIDTEKEIFTISRSPSDRSNHFPIDISNLEAFKDRLFRLSDEYEKLDIYFLAGESSVDSSVAKPVSSFSESVIPFLTLLESMKNKSSTIVYSSTGAIYDSREETFFDENSALYPPSPYAASKHACEGIAMSYHETYALDIRIARIFSVFGPKMNRFFIYDFIEKISKDEKSIQLFGTGKQVRDYLHVDDVCSGLLTIMENGTAGEIYNLSSGKPTSLTELSDRIMEILEIGDIEISWDATQTVGTRDRWYGDNSKIKGIGFKRKENFDDQLQSTVKEIYSKFN